MPEGQFTGRRKAYIYTMDDGETDILLSLDETLASVAESGLLLADAQSAEDSDPKPLRFEPRGVFWQGTLDGRIVRKFLVCGNTDATLYTQNTSQEVTIDGVDGKTTGKKGEKLSFVRIEDGAAPAPE
jgi:hypothetical protein